MTTLRIQCSNCMSDLKLDTAHHSITVHIPASGRGSKRIEAHDITNPVDDNEALYLWDALCCDDYADSLDKTELDYQDIW